MLRTRNNTDGNKLVIFSGIALYYGDNYILPVDNVVYKVSNVYNMYNHQYSNNVYNVYNVYNMYNYQ